MVRPFAFSAKAGSALSLPWATERREVVERVIRNENPRPVSPKTGDTRAGTLVSKISWASPTLVSKIRKKGYFLNSGRPWWYVLLMIVCKS